MGIKIPNGLETILNSDSAWAAKITKLRMNVEPLLTNQQEFFPDYTIHGETHINEVLKNADNLIHSKTREMLLARDAAFLIAAIIIHDIGMFMSHASVVELLAASKEWAQKWEQFVDHTKRYPEDKMRYCFGKNITVKEQIPPAGEMTRDDRLVVGEFLRQNHPHLADYIAENGMPGAKEQDVFRSTDFLDKDRKMIGLLALSHGETIRDMEPLVNKAFGKRPNPYKLPVQYLMAVLRMADLLDAGDHRAPVALQDLVGIPVPLSLEEWTWNQRINHDASDWDPQTKNFYIDANPTNSIEYVQLDKWLKSCQSELDLCWSVIAEKYLDNPYRLSIHRVTSNITDPDVQEDMNSRFLTEEVKITANPEITKLMIAPLYGNDPSYGVRELLQNAVDACLERKRKEPDHKGLVTVRIDPFEDPETGKNVGVFTIEDNGVGMNAHVLMNYYLAAGASYRSSDEWKQDNTADGKSQVARTGRFGVGFLAAFLLGDSVSVTTQHIADKKGYTFEFTNKAKPLNISRTKRDDGAGTTIRIVLKPGVLDALTERNARYPWHNWYAFDKPEVRYFLDGQRIKYKSVSLHREPQENTDCFSMDPGAFEAYLWHPKTLNNNNSRYGSTFLCNGIRVYDTSMPHTLEEFGLEVDAPHVSVLDPDAALEINLARSEVETFPNRDALLEQVFRYHIARLLMTRWDTEADYRDHLTQGFLLRQSNYHGHIPYLFTSAGFTLNYASVLRSMDIPELVLLYYDRSSADTALQDACRFLPEAMPISVAYRGEDFASCDKFVNNVLSSDRGLWDEFAMGYDIGKQPRSILMHQSVYQELDSRNHERLPTPIPFDKMYRFDLRGGLPEDTVRVIDRLDPELFPFSMQLHLSGYDYRLRKYGSPDLLFPQLLLKLLGPNEAHPDRDMWIPFDMEERRKKFPEAFEELKPFFEYNDRNPTP